MSEPEVVSLDAQGDQALLSPALMPFDTQAYLERNGWVEGRVAARERPGKGSGLAKLQIQTPEGFMPAGKWIDRVASEFRIQPSYLLAVLQGEQSLLSSPLVPRTGFKVVNLPGAPSDVPPKSGQVGGWKSKSPKPAPLGAGHFVVRNGGPVFTADGNWFVDVDGDYKLWFALGAGAPDPDVHPSHDVRAYGGLANQIRQAARLLRKYLNDYATWATSGDPADRKKLVINSYEGRQLFPADGPTYALLRFTPSAKVLTSRPALARRIREEAQALGVA